MKIVRELRRYKILLNSYKAKLSIVMFLGVIITMYLFKKYNLIFDEEILKFENSILLNISILTVYGIFFGFLQSLIGNNLSNNKFWGVNKVEFYILGKTIYSVVNTFTTKLIIITFIISPIINFIITNLEVESLLEKLIIINIVWQVCLMYLVVIFGFLLIQSLTGLFDLLKMGNDSDYDIKYKIKQSILKEVLNKLRTYNSLDILNKIKLRIDDNEKFEFTKFIYIEVLIYLCNNAESDEWENIIFTVENYLNSENFLSSEKSEFIKFIHIKVLMYLYKIAENNRDKNIRFTLENFLNERHLYIKELTVKEKICILNEEIKNIKSKLMFKKNKENIKKYISDSENLLNPFYEILSEIESAEDMISLIDLIVNSDYFDFKNNKNEYSIQANKIARGVFYSIKKNFDDMNNENLRRKLIEIHNREEEIARNFFEEIYMASYKNCENDKALIKFILGTLNENYTYAFILYCTLHYGSNSETILKEEIDYFRELYSLIIERKGVDKRKVCEIVNGTNIGHKVNYELIDCIVNNIEGGINNEIIRNISRYKYIDYFDFLKIKVIFREQNSVYYFEKEYFKDLDNIEDELKDEILLTYFTKIASNIKILNNEYIYEHHIKFMTLFKIDILNLIKKRKYEAYTNSYSYIILYMVSYKVENSEYFITKEFIESYNITDYYIEEIFIKFMLLSIDKWYLDKILTEYKYVKKSIEKRLQYIAREGELDEYINDVYSPIKEIDKIMGIKNLKEKVYKKFNVSWK